MAMTDWRALDRLCEISALIRDVKLGDLDRVRQARDANLARLATLNTPRADPDLAPVAAHQADLRYQAWADVRRAELNIAIAGQTATLEEAKDAARAALGRHDVLTTLAQRRR